ncbi:amidase signature domain-containing protein [Crepidotus variabilis]|uniref:Amidase signature domain-containing protein n=1 Tax=Crepidotus variabilis TaxID=179855 RepID=A0A9P6JM95_9AGAR|nr:amidase signature domain-containing protein [Crepidotus variabilis]
MIFPSASKHRRVCASKQQERQSQIDALPQYAAQLTLSEEKIHSLPIPQLVAQCRSGSLKPSTILMAYGKKALLAHKATNCVTDFMFEEALSTASIADWGQGLESDSSITDKTRERSLLGVPVSIKDTVDIEGHDTTFGYSCNVGRPAIASAGIVRMLQDAGALVHVKTSVPTSLIALETYSDVYGLTKNPYNPAFGVGGSTGGGGALIACGGAKIEIGTDVAGSVRIPAHFCGIWSLKASLGRFPSWGTGSSIPGLEAIPIVASPMAGSLDDLHEFWKRIMLAEPWQYDHTCVPLAWRDVNLQDEGRKLKWGVIWEDGAVPPTPACRRALATVISALKKQGHEVVDFNPPDVLSGLKVANQLLFSDGGSQIQRPLSPGEKLSHATTSIIGLLQMPRFIKNILAWFMSSTDPLSSDLHKLMHTKTVVEERDLVVARDRYRAEWHQKWIEEGLDFVLTVPSPFPATEHGASEKTTLISAGYTFLFSLLDYSAGVMPVTHVDRELDALPPNFEATKVYKSLTTVAKLGYGVYDANKMHGLPLGVQIAGRRLEEEKVLQGMHVIENALLEQKSSFFNTLKL